MIKNTWEMYEMIDKVEKVGFKLLRFLMGWSERKTKRHLNKLINGGIVKSKKGCELCGNDNEIYYPTPWKDLVNWEEMNSEPDEWKDKLNDLYTKLDKLCENKEHNWEELYDGIKQCKRCFKVEDIIKEEKRDD